jgi:hypothetical protein
LGERGKTPPKRAGSDLGNFLSFFLLSTSRHYEIKEYYTMMRSHHVFALHIFLLKSYSTKKMKTKNSSSTINGQNICRHECPKRCQHDADSGATSNNLIVGKGRLWKDFKLKKIKVKQRITDFLIFFKRRKAATPLA